jgi:hypothetical protein
METYTPILHALAARYDADTFVYVLNSFNQDPRGFNADFIKVFNMSHFFIIAEANVWDIFHGREAAIVYQSILNKIAKNGISISRDLASKRLGDSGYSGENDIFQSRMSALIFVKTFIEEYEQAKRQRRNV